MKPFFLAGALLVPFVLCSIGALAAEAGTLKLRILETEAEDSGAPVPARVHLKGPDGKSVEAPGLPFWRDHFSCDGVAELAVAPGVYTYIIERGPEYRRATGTIRVIADEVIETTVFLERWIDLAARRWWSGETHVHRPLDEVALLMRAEDLHVAPVLTVWNQRNLWRERKLPPDLLVEIEKARFLHVLACEDEREGGALLYFNMDRPLDLTGDAREYPSPVDHLRDAVRQREVWVDIEKPFWWDVPTWVATGEIDSIGIANNHMCRSQMYENEAWGRPRDEKRLPAPRGNGFHTQEIYYRLLNCGFRLPPSAGSASGVLPNPVGYNRVYVHLDGPLTYDAWWKGLAQGRSFVTNGPVLLVRANGRLPGEIFRAAGPLDIALDVLVDGNDALESVEVIRDGKVVQRFLPGEVGPGKREWLRPDTLRFEKSGWLLVRAIADVPHTFRFASTAPFYVEVGGQSRIVHTTDAEYFVAWIKERIERVRQSKHLEDETQRDSVLAPHLQALRIFEKLATSGR